MNSFWFLILMISGTKNHGFSTWLIFGHFWNDTLWIYLGFWFGWVLELNARDSQSFLFFAYFLIRIRNIFDFWILSERNAMISLGFWFGRLLERNARDSHFFYFQRLSGDPLDSPPPCTLRWFLLLLCCPPPAYSAFKVCCCVAPRQHFLIF